MYIVVVVVVVLVVAEPLHRLVLLALDIAWHMQSDVYKIILEYRLCVQGFFLKPRDWKKCHL